MNLLQKLFFKKSIQEKMELQAHISQLQDKKQRIWEQAEDLTQEVALLKQQLEETTQEKEALGQQLNTQKDEIQLLQQEKDQLVTIQAATKKQVTKLTSQKTVLQHLLKRQKKAQRKLTNKHKGTSRNNIEKIEAPATQTTSKEMAGKIKTQTEFINRPVNMGRRIVAPRVRKR